jgi:hypothetical protein
VIYAKNGFDARSLNPTLLNFINSGIGSTSVTLPGTSMLRSLFIVQSLEIRNSILLLLHQSSINFLLPIPNVPNLSLLSQVNDSETPYVF